MVTKKTAIESSHTGPNRPDAVSLERFQVGSEPWCRLRLSLVSGVGPILFQRLIQTFGSASAALGASARQLSGVEGVGRRVVSRMLKDECEQTPEDVLADCQAAGVELVVLGDAEYPTWLSEIADPPPVLYVRGTLADAGLPGIAVVGTRHMSFYGEEVARDLARQASRAGFAVVSGLARGIDQVAHQAALDSQGVTVAVLGGGHSRLYPQEHHALAAAISRQGAVLSEYPPQTRPSAAHFPRRNRIIVGCCAAVVVVEAAMRSGALITARIAADENRDVFAVPGPITSRTSRGCHELIRQGAHLIESFDDVLNQVRASLTSQPLGQPEQPRPSIELSDEDRQILSLISNQPILIDQVLQNSERPCHQVLAAISRLEAAGAVARHGGSSLTRLANA